VQICSGKVLRCLTDHRAELKSESCKSEVLYFEKMEVTDFRNDVILAASCRMDVDKFCPNIDPGVWCDVCVCVFDVKSWLPDVAWMWTSSVLTLTQVCGVTCACVYVTWN